MKFSNKVSKVNQVIERVMQEIAEGIYALNDPLPSVNELSQKIKVSRDTVFKAYTVLKQRGIIDSAPMKGYFVLDEVKRVLLLLDVYSPFKERLYNTFVANLPANAKVDLLFHQYNEKLFDMIVNDSIGKYNAYIIMNLSNTAMLPCLLKLPASKLLLIDMCSFPKEEFAYISQNFDTAFYSVLQEALPKLKHYGRVLFVFPPESVHPVEAMLAFTRFCADYKVKGSVMRRHFEENDLEENAAYICIMTDDLVKIVTAGNRHNFRFGEDAGVVVYNDMPLLEVIQDGISAFTIDFAELGRLAADFVVKGERMQVDMLTRFIERKSL